MVIPESVYSKLAKIECPNQTVLGNPFHREMCLLILLVLQRVRKIIKS